MRSGVGALNLVHEPPEPRRPGRVIVHVLPLHLGFRRQAPQKRQVCAIQHVVDAVHTKILINASLRRQQLRDAPVHSLGNLQHIV